MAKGCSLKSHTVSSNNHLNKETNMNQYKKTTITTLTLICSVFFIAQSFAGNLADVRAEYENLTARYMFAFDFLNVDDYVATFTEDGIFNHRGEIKRGRQEIREWISGAKKRKKERDAKALSEGKKVERVRHFITNMVIDVKGDKAAAKAYWVKLSSGNDDYANIEKFGQYQDSLEYVNGEWLFSKRIISD
jgi:hypothetical protein